jgi:D-beta-D-heptose 7-phosphate kinase/D-beta-D-heptose 1-phosphate adenosyltransferase
MPSPKILVYGDVMLDVYVTGTVKRASPEAPGVPVLSDYEMRYLPGGAANVAANIVALGGEAMVLGQVGADPAAMMLKMVLIEKGVSMEFLVREQSRTTAKTRLVGDGRHLVRLDIETPAPISGEDEADMMDKLLDLVPQAQAIVISDYAKGAVTPRLAAGVIGMARPRGIPVVVDAKEPDAKQYRGATVIKPNLKEITIALGMKEPPSSQNVAVKAASTLLTKSKGTEYVLLTRGEHGMALVGRANTMVIPAHEVRAVDVTGAGDAAAAALALALACGESIVEASLFANAAAAVVVTKSGTATPTPAEVRFFYDDRDSGKPRAGRSSMAEAEASNRLH